MDIQQMKVPPHNMEAEQAILGALFMEPSILPRIQTRISAEDFYRESHSEIFSAMERLHKASDPIDAVTVSTELDKSGKLEKTGGVDYLAVIIQGASSSAGWKYYAEEIKDNSIRRKLITSFLEAYHNLFSKIPTNDILSETKHSIVEIESSDDDIQTVHISKIVPLVLESIETKNERGIPSGFYGLDKVTMGWQGGDLIIIAGRPGMGKGQPVNEPVLTDSGWKTIGDLNIGDKVFSMGGNQTKVSAIQNKGTRDCYKFTFNDGVSTIVDLDHLWIVKHRNQGKEWFVKSTYDLIEYQCKFDKHWRIYIPLTKPIQFSPRIIPIKPYLLGALLGDGYLHESVNSKNGWMVRKVQLTTNDPEMLKYLGIESREVKYSKYGYSIKGLCGQLVELGLIGKRSWEKFIPQQYLINSVKVRLGVLKGLMDTDGSIDTNGTIEFTSTSKQLASDVQFIVHSLGGKATIHKHKSSYRKGGKRILCRDKYRVRINMQICPFKLERKRERFKIKNCNRVVRSIEKIGKTECVCIGVEDLSGSYITKDFIVTHNSVFAKDCAEHSGVPTLYFSLEMSKEQLVKRQLSGISGVNHDCLRSGKLESNEWADIIDASDKLIEMPIFYNDNGKMTIGKICAISETYKMTKGLGLVIVDYLQLIRSDVRGSVREQEVAAISRDLKGLARELGIPVIALAQLNRGCESRKPPIPILSDLRESGGLEQDADFVGFLYRPWMYDNTKDPHEAHLYLAKGRNTRTGKIDLIFRGENQVFQNPWRVQ